MKLLLGNCLEVMPSIPNASIDLILCDPPYKMTKRGKSCRPNWMPSNMGDNFFAGEIPNTDLWMQLCYDKLKEGTHFYVFTNTVSLQEYLNGATKCGFKLQNIISMIKDTGMPNKWYYKQTELVLLFRKGRAKPINDMTSRDNIQVVMPKMSSGKLHITQKPLDFIERLVTNSSKPGETVLDLFMGSNTTGVACVNTGREFIGIEMDENAYKIAVNRTNEAIAAKKTNK
jgi:site-specific DNA-methyltransferase (adenine-specific)